MSERRSFYRKIGYAVAIMALLFPLAWLSRPATVAKPGEPSDPGGKLAQLRTDHQLGQANLGDIDPASETMKLATLGLRGVAVNLLWGKANHFKKVEDWDNLSATLNQLAYLQPNFITFWKFQAWNLSYNVSVEFDDYKDRYAKVIEGINFLMRGERYNLGNPQLLWDLGWFIGQKIGRADEHVQYRRLFKADDDFHPADRPPDQRDNWLVGKQWYELGIASVNSDPSRLGRKNPRVFFSSPAMSQINYAAAIEEEGFFDKARRAWIRAAEEWAQFGALPIEHSTGVKLRLGEKSRLEKQVADLQAELDGLQTGVRDKLIEEKRAALTAEERQLLDSPRDHLTADQYSKLSEAEMKIAVTDRDVADEIARAVPEKGRQAYKLASELGRAQSELQYTINYRRDSNYDYWEMRCDFEQTPNALSARELMYRAKKAADAGDVEEAKSLYDEGFAKWRLVIDQFPAILDEEAITGDDLMDYVKEYHEVLVLLNEELGDEFPLWDIIERFDSEQLFTEQLMRRHEHGAHAPDEATPPGTSSADPSDAPEEGANSTDPAAADLTAEEAVAPSPGENEGAEQQAAPAVEDAPPAE